MSHTRGHVTSEWRISESLKESNQEVKHLK